MRKKQLQLTRLPKYVLSFFAFHRFQDVRTIVKTTFYLLLAITCSGAETNTGFVPGEDDPEEVYQTVRESINFGREDRLELIEAAEAFAQATNDKKLQNRILRCRSVNSIISGDAPKGLEYAITALEEARQEQLEVEEEIHALNLLGQAKSVNGNTTEALKCYQTASKLAKELGSAKEVFISGIMESNLYIKLQKLDQALEVMKWMENYYDAYDDAAHRLIYTHNYADCLFAKEQYSEVVHFIDEHVGYENTQGDLLRDSVRLLYLMSALEAKVDWDDGKGSLQSQVEHIATSLKKESDSRALLICWSFVARVWYLIGELEEAEQAVDVARQMTDAIPEKQLQANLLEVEARVAKKRGDYQTALEKTEALVALAKEIRDESILKQIEILREEHQVALKNTEIERLHAENQWQQRLIKTQHQRIYASLLLLLLLFIAGVLGMILIRSKNKNLKIEKLRSEEALKVNQKLREAEANKDYFLAVVSHELRNPLNGIVGTLSLLEQEEKNPEIKPMIDLMSDSANSMLDQINEILEYSKAEAGKLEIVEKEVEIRTLCESVLNLWNGKAQTEEIELTSTIDSEVPRFFTGDPYRIRQVLSNLIGNAIKFTPSGTITLNVFIDQKECVFEVKDTGIGLSPKEISVLFQPFQQANRETAQKFGGTGLGLSICKSLAEAMNGRMEVHSEKGKGSSFFFRIPLKEAK